MPEGQCRVWVGYVSKTEPGDNWRRTCSWVGCLAVIQIGPDQDGDHFAWVMNSVIDHSVRVAPLAFLAYPLARTHEKLKKQIHVPEILPAGRRNRHLRADYPA